MRTTLELRGVPELIYEKAVKVGLARSKADAARLGAFALNREYKLVKDIELELVERKLRKEETQLNGKYLSEDEALSKYR